MRCSSPGSSWLHGHVAGLIKELLKSAELRLDRQRKLRLPTREEIARGVRCVARGDLISIVTSPNERETMDRVQAVMAVIEGHAEHVMDAVAPDLLPSLPSSVPRSTEGGTRSPASTGWWRGCSVSS